MAVETFPFYIDPNVEHVGVSKLRKLNSRELRKIRKAMVFQDNDTPLAVLLKYEQFLAMQDQLYSLQQTIELLTSPDEVAGVVEGLKAWKEGRTKSLTDIRQSLKETK